MLEVADDNMIAPALAGVQAFIVGSDEYLLLAKPGRWNDIRGAAGDTVTLLPVIFRSVSLVEPEARVAK